LELNRKTYEEAILGKIMERNIALLMALIMLLAACGQQEQTKIIIRTEQKEVPISVEIVDTPEERQLGLMYRASMEENHGMWFVFEDAQPYAFWMKNTLIPLDMVFVDSNMQVVDIIKADSCLEDPCKTYTPKAAAKFVLELNQNFTDRAGVKVGNMVKVG
jgi:uncharacterized membrane protein (UPF0127 family)